MSEILIPAVAWIPPLAGLISDVETEVALLDMAEARLQFAYQGGFSFQRTYFRGAMPGFASNAALRVSWYSEDTDSGGDEVNWGVRVMSWIDNDTFNGRRGDLAEFDANNSGLDTMSSAGGGMAQTTIALPNLNNGGPNDVYGFLLGRDARGVTGLDSHDHPVFLVHALLTWDT